jgi:two-component system sensor histidine kinase/response regulator
MNTGQILLVDDDPTLLQALPQAISLRMSGVEVETTDSAQVALAMIQQHEYDAIVSDIKMPGMDGLDLLATVQKRYPETPVMLITGHGEHELAIRALRGGAYDYLLKPIDRDDFMASLHRALQTRQLRRQIEQQQRALERSAFSLERLVEQRTAELRASNAAKDAMLSMVAHELTSALGGLKAMMEVSNLQPQPANGMEQARQGVVKVEPSFQRIERLVHDLQDTSLIQAKRFALHCTHSDLVDLCRSALDEYRTGTSVALTFEVRDDHLQAEVDPVRIRQGLLNLLSNAHKYSPEGSCITIILQRRGAEAVISVRDQGPGIAEEQLLHICEPFYRVPGIEVQPGASPGLGLGLYITRTIVEQHGGCIQVQGQPGDGSTFSMVLPLEAKHERH